MDQEMVAEAQKGEYKYGVSIHNNSISIYYKVCSGYNCYSERGFTLVSNILEEYEINTKVGGDRKIISTIMLSDNEAQEIEIAAKRILKLYNEKRYNDMLKMYLATNIYIGSIINNYITTLKNAYNNLYDAVIKLVDARRYKEKEPYKVKIRYISTWAELQIYNYTYSVTIDKSNVYMSYIERYGNSGEGCEIEVMLGVGVLRAARTYYNQSSVNKKYKGIVWLRGDEAMTISNYAEQLINHMQQYNYNAIANTFNNMAKYVNELAAQADHNT